MLPILLSVFAFTCIATTNAHSAFFHPSMYGFNVTQGDFPYDNRPVAPLKDYTFQQWWMHGHMDFPPNQGDVFNLPAGGKAVAEIACNKGATSYFASSDGSSDVRRLADPQDPCPGQPSLRYHAVDKNDVRGCALAIAYKSDVKAVQPEDFAIFSVNQTCVWRKDTVFEIPEKMPPCPAGGCICSFFWVHSENGGGQENYMNAFKCDVSGSISQTAVAPAQLPRRCGEDIKNQKMDAVPGNCTYGAKAPFYWLQKERNNMFEGVFSPPSYNDMYNFLDGAQEDIFLDSYDSMPKPGENQTELPVLRAHPSSALKQATGVPSLKMLAVDSLSFDGPASVNGTAILSEGEVPVKAQAGGKICRRRVAREAEEVKTGGLRKRVLAMSKRSRKLTKRNSLWSLW